MPSLWTRVERPAHGAGRADVEAEARPALHPLRQMAESRALCAVRREVSSAYAGLSGWRECEMPRKVTAWACKYKCGAKVQTSHSRMLHHEARCLRNPSRRACTTCKWDWTEHDWDDEGHRWQNDGCEIDKRPADCRCVVECAHWVANAPRERTAVAGTLDGVVGHSESGDK